MRMRLPETSIITQLGGSLREIRDTWGVSKEAMAGIVPESRLEWGLGEEGDRASRPPEADMLAAHDAVTTNSLKAQQKLGKLVNQGKHAAQTHSLVRSAAGHGTPSGTGRPAQGVRNQGLRRSSL